jgi:hypothetical protein
VSVQAGLVLLLGMAGSIAAVQRLLPRWATGRHRSVSTDTDPGADPDPDSRAHSKPDTSMHTWQVQVDRSQLLRAPYVYESCDQHIGLPRRGVDGWLGISAILRKHRDCQREVPMVECLLHLEWRHVHPSRCNNIQLC